MVISRILFIRFCCLLAGLFLLSTPLSAHVSQPPVGKKDRALIRSYVDPMTWDEFNTFYWGGNAAFSYRLKEPSLVNEQWNLMGALLGGESYAPHIGLGVDEVFALLGYNKKNYYISIHAGSHGMEHSPSFEQVLLGWRAIENLVMEVGRMGGEFTEQVSRHASQSLYVSKPLIYEVLWGRQYIGDGIRLRGLYGSESNRLVYGVELWQGRAFPSRCKTDRCVAYDAYLNYSYRFSLFRLTSNLFYYKGYSAQRTDDRYSASGGHSHQVNSPTTDNADKVWVEGVVQAYGLSLGVEAFDLGSLSYGLEFEYMSSRQEGRLGQNLRSVDYKNHYRGLNGIISVNGEFWTLSARYERLQLANYLHGDSAAALEIAKNAFLSGSSALKDPIRWGASLRWAADESLTFGGEISRERGVFRQGYSSSVALSATYVMPVKPLVLDP